LGFVRSFGKVGGLVLGKDAGKSIRQ